MIGGARQTERTADTSHAEDRRAPDVRPQSHPVDQPRVERRTRDPSNRNHVERVEIPAPEAGPFERLVERPLTEFRGYLQPGPVGLAEGREARVSFQRKGQMALIDATARMQPFEYRRMLQALSPMAL